MSYKERSLIIPPECHFSGHPAYRGSGAMKMLKARFSEKGLLDRVKKSKFGPFFRTQDLKFSGVIFHELMLRKVDAPIDKCEVHFLVGSKTCRFGRDEFCLMTGLNYTKEPSCEEMEIYGSNDRLIRDYFNCKQKIPLKALLDVIINKCEDPDDLYKLGLCYFVEAVLFGTNKTAVWLDMLKFVDNLDFFFSYPWGKMSFNKLIGSCMKDMVYCKDKCQAKIERGQQKEAKYDVFGYAPALQYWAYEAIIGKEYGVYHGIKFPRMLSWSSSRPKPTSKGLRNWFTKKVEDVYERLSPRPDELDYYHSLTGDDLISISQSELKNTIEISDDFSETSAKVEEDLAVNSSSSVSCSPTRTIKRPQHFNDYTDPAKSKKKRPEADDIANTGSKTKAQQIKQEDIVHTGVPTHIGHQSSQKSPTLDQGEIQRESLDCNMTEPSNCSSRQPAAKSPIAPPTNDVAPKLKSIQKELEEVTKRHQDKESMLLSKCEKEILEVRKKYDALIEENEMSLTNQKKIIEQYRELVLANTQSAELLARNYNVTQ